MKRRILVFGIKRNGNHAIIGYLLGHFLEYYNLSQKPKEEALTYFLEHSIYINDWQYNPPEQLPDYQLISFEDKGLDFVAGDKVVILRDPYNWVASVVHHPGSHYLLKELSVLWPKYAKAATQKDVIFCNYNSWNIDKDYRADFSRRVGLEPTDVWYNAVLNFGGGSSFDGLNYDMKPERMATQDRWKTLTEQEKQHITPEMKELSRELFRFNPF